MSPTWKSPVFARSDSWAKDSTSMAISRSTLFSQSKSIGSRLKTGSFFEAFFFFSSLSFSTRSHKNSWRAVIVPLICLGVALRSVLSFSCTSVLPAVNAAVQAPPLPWRFNSASRCTGPMGRHLRSNIAPISCRSRAVRLLLRSRVEGSLKFSKWPSTLRVRSSGCPVSTWSDSMPRVPSLSEIDSWPVTSPSSGSFWKSAKAAKRRPSKCNCASTLTPFIAERSFTYPVAFRTGLTVSPSSNWAESMETFLFLSRMLAWAASGPSSGMR